MNIAEVNTIITEDIAKIGLGADTATFELDGWFFTDPDQFEDFVDFVHDEFTGDNFDLDLNTEDGEIFFRINTDDTQSELFVAKFEG